MVTKFVAEVDERELAVRLAEAACGMLRPEGADTAAAYEALDASPHFAQFKRLARVAMSFFQEHVDKLTPVS